MTNRRKVQHVTDSLARAKVAGSIPEDWEWREATGRDYGIDMYVEPFEDEDTLGSILFLQIKGRRLNAQDDVEVGLTYDTSALLYAERFLSPMVLAYCPVGDQRPSFRFIWLQEYIRVRLPVDAVDWRNRERNRLYFPISNRVQGGSDRFLEGDQRLRYIARYPVRLDSWGKLTLIQNDIRRLSHAMLNAQQAPAAEVTAVRQLFTQARDLPGLSEDPANWQARLSWAEAIQPALQACNLLEQGQPFNRAQIEALGWQHAGLAAPANNLEALLTRLDRAGEQLSSYLANVMDADAARAIWAQHYRGDF